MNILITGGCGYIGSQLANYLIEKNHKIIVIDDLSNGKKKNLSKNIIFYRGKYYNKKILTKIFKEFKIEIVFHLAAYTSLTDDKKYKENYFINNSLGIINLIELMKKYKIKKLIFSSSASIYGLNKNKILEDSELRPVSNYGLSKLFSEKIIIRKCKEYKIRYLIFRLFNVVGGKVKNQGFFHLIKEKLRNKEKIKIYGNDHNTFDGTCVRDYIHMEQVINIFFNSISFLKKPKDNLIFNVGNSVGISVKEIINFLEKHLSRKIKTIILKKRDFEIPISISNNKNILKNRLLQKELKFDEIIRKSLIK